jgi:hypothetical protein
MPAPPVQASRAAAAAGQPAIAAVPSAARRRLIAALVAIAALAVLGVAAVIEPSPTGLGTHEQFHMPRCGWITLMDTPCPTCGWTTAFAHAADGNILASFRTQPTGCLLALAAILGLYVAFTGSPVASVLKRLWGRSTGWLVAAVVLVSWGYKILSHKGVL